MLIFTPLVVLAEANSASKPMLVYGSGRGANEGRLMAKRLQASAPSGKEFLIDEQPSNVPPAEFHRYGCIVIAGSEEGKEVWSEDDCRRVESWLKDGGRLIFLNASSTALLGEVKGNPHLEAILGAKRITKGKASEWFGTDWTPSGLSNSEPWMEGGAALTQLTTAQALCGWSSEKGEKSALVGLNNVGKGAVLYIGISARKSGGEGGLGSLNNLILKFIGDMTPVMRASVQKKWDTVALGGVAERKSSHKAPIKKELKSLRKVVELPGEPLLIAGNGVKTVIVTPVKPSSSEKLAAEEIALAFLRIAKVTVPILAEDRVVVTPGKEQYGIREAKGDRYDRAVLVGDSQILRGVKITADDLPEEGLRFRTEKNLLCVVGKDRHPNGRKLMGTYYGALALLEEELGVRWLWPGENGEVYPKQSDIFVRRREVTDAPALGQRRLRNAGAVALGGMEPEALENRDRSKLEALFKEHKTSNTVKRVSYALSAMDESMSDYFKKFSTSSDWFRHQRTGGSFNLQYTHAYDDWYEQYGKSHPEWFALQPNESRVPAAPARIRLCKANAALTDEIAAVTLRKAAATPGVDSISISPNDGGAENFFCMCADCRALDPSNGDLVDFEVRLDGKKLSFRYPSLSDRVVNFYNRIAEKVASTDPGLKLGAYAYSFYRTPPLREALHPNVVVGFVGLTYFDDSRLNRDRESWNGWANTANSLFLRPNAFHLGHGFPGVFVHKMDRDIKHCYQTGMMGADFDAIVHHWSTQGLNYYVIAKLLWDPSLDVDALVDDYCKAGFGSAAPSIKQYFSRIEELTELAASQVGNELEQAVRNEEVVETRKNPLDSFLTIAPTIYTPERIAGLSAILETARNEAKGNKEILERINFLQVGLDYADVQSRLYKLVAEKKLNTPEGLALFEEREKFFKRSFHDSFYAVGLVHVVRREAGIYSIAKKGAAAP